jgi:hypothetical protein
MTWTLAGIEGIIRSSWGADTCPPDVHNPVWDPANRARGQCGVTALVVHDLLGGDLVRAEVRAAGERVDFHWWNLLPGGVEVDLTREQFGPEEIVTAAVALARPTTSGWAEAPLPALISPSGGRRFRRRRRRR